MAHGGLTTSSQFELILWVHCEVDEWLENDLVVNFYVSSQCVSCELKFFTGEDCLRADGDFLDESLTVNYVADR